MPSERATIFDSLAVLLDAGVPLSRALPTAVADFDGATALAVRALAREVEAGKTLGEAVEVPGRGFTNFDRSLIRAGEAGGRLPEALQTLAEWHGFEWRIGRQLLSALVLPALVIHLAAIVWPLAMFVIHDSSVGTLLLDVLGNLVGWYLATAAVWLVLRHEGLKRSLGHVLLGLPLLGRAIRHLELSRYCRAFQSLLEGGLGASETAELATNVCGNPAVADLLRGGVASADAGDPISAGFSPALGREFTTSWRSGELSGKLDEVTARLAQHHGERAEALFAEIARWVPRLAYGVVMLQLSGMILSGGGISPGSSGLQVP